jgi:hypothetical protein
MTKMFTILIIGLQVALTFVATVCIYMVYAFFDNDFGFDGLFGLVVIQPIIGVLLSLLTIFLCSLVGLPIRLNKNLNRWWRTHFYISLLCVVFGLTFLVLAFLPNLQHTVTTEIHGQTTIKHIPNSYLAITGWFLTAFTLLHLYPPQQLTDKIKSMFQKDLIETPDIKEKIYSDFGDKAETVIKMLREAIAKHDYINSGRILRCIIYLTDKNFEVLTKYINNAIGDPRDVMYWAEYINREQGFEGNPKRVRNFNKTFQNCENNVNE